MNGTLLGAGGDYFLYETQTFSGLLIETDKLRNASTGAEVTLSNADLSPSISEDFLSHIITPLAVYGRYQNRPSQCQGSCIMRWSTADGSATIIDNTHPLAGSGQANRFIAKDRYLFWPSSSATMVISMLDTQGGAITTIVPPNGDTVITDFDVAIVAGAPVVYYWSSTSYNPGRTINLYRWTAAGGSQLLDTDFVLISTYSDAFTTFQPRVEADNNWLAYTKLVPVGAGGGGNRNASVVRQSTSGGQTFTMASNASEFQLRDGVLLWWEHPFDSASWMAWSAARGAENLGAVTLSSAMRGVGGGFAIYSLGNQTPMFTWNGATGARVERTTMLAFPMYPTDNWIYFRSGNWVYRMALS